MYEQVLTLNYLDSLTSPSVKDFNDGANQFAEYITDNLRKYAPLSLKL